MTPVVDEIAVSIRITNEYGESNIMRKVLLFSIVAASIGFASLGVEARPTGSPNVLEQSRQIDQIIFGRHNRRRHNRNNNDSIRYETRIVHKGNKTYRDTYRIEWKNGHEKTKRVSHVRIG